MSKIIKAELLDVKLPASYVFRTSFGEVKDRETIVVKLTTDAGIVGYGESAPLPEPVYLEEDIATCKHIIDDFLFPIVLGPTLRPEEFVANTDYLRCNRMAKFGVECALWDIYSQEVQIPIAKLLGSTRKTVAIGSSIGLLPKIEDTIKIVEKRLGQGYKRIKLKISPGHDVEFVKTIRKKFPHAVLMVDANSAYSLKDIKVFKELDKLDLLMIEQPLGFDDIVDHAKLQSQLKTPICLDESIVNYEQARKAIELGSCRIINVKPGRVGGLVESKRINELAKQQHIGLWCGGMLEGGIGKIYNMLVASLSEYIYPADTTLANDYLPEALIKPDLVFIRPGGIAVPNFIGLEHLVNQEAIQNHLLEKIERHL